MNLLSQRPASRGVEIGTLAAAIDAKITQGDHATVVYGVSVDSSDIRPGDLFIALPGFTTHGAKYAGDAIRRGAVAVLTDTNGAHMVATDQEVTILTSADPRAQVGPLAARVYGDPSSHVPVFAITGTNGKTTTATLLRHLLDHSYHPTGLCSTVHLSLGDQTVPSPRTTVEASVLQRICALGVERGIGALVVEVSSHAIALGRVGAMHFRSAGFTNMDHEHLDFHHTMDEYFETKAQLFTPAFTDAAVICVDSPWGVKLADRTEVETLSVSTTGVPADLMATDITPRDDGIGFQVRSADEQVDMFLPIPAAVMVQNAMVAIAMATQQGMDLATIADRLASAPSPDGRMVSIQRRTDTLPACIVDFAHTADALSRILTDVRATTPGKLWVIFGSDGERDWEKRPHMGRAVAAIADVVYVTDENPRFEDAAAIRHQILAGARAERGDDPNIVEFDNRAAAVRAAVLNAHPDDTVIATGKGNEEYQEIKGEKIPYYDGDVMRAALAERGGAQ